MLRWRTTLVTCLVLSSAAASSAQNFDSHLWFVRGGMTPGFILPTNPFGTVANGATEPIHVAPNLTIEIGRRTDGTSAWHDLYGTPSYGFGFSFVPLPDSGENTTPVEAYTFFSWPFARLSDRVQVTSDFGMGLSWRWKHMNEATDAYENVLGSNLNARVNWGFYLRYLSTPRMAVYSGVDFTHRSNGGMVQPDLGINVIGPKVTVQYNFADEPLTRSDIAPPAFTPSWEFVVGGLGGMKNVVERREPLARANFGAFAITSALQRHFYRFGKIAGGTDLTYDGATGARIDGNDLEWRAPSGQRWGLGLYGGYEHVIGRFGALMQVGSNVARGFANPHAPRLYARYGWRYQIHDHVWGIFAIRSHGFRRANVLEFGAGVRLRRWSLR
jgi:Lipid A 3-O-deacylase (PagL)